MTKLELMQHYRNTFFTPSGHEVLKDLMKQGYFFNFGEAEITADMPEAIGKRNLVNYILNMLGCADNPELAFDSIINGMANVPIISKTTDKEENEDDE